MAPAALFDKSFLRALNVDEAVLFDAFFLPVVCPLYYVKTLADLAQELAAGPGQRDREATVGSLAYKTPEMNGGVCVHLAEMVTARASSSRRGCPGANWLDWPRVGLSETNAPSPSRNQPLSGIPLLPPGLPTRPADSPAPTQARPASQRPACRTLP